MKRMKKVLSVILTIVMVLVVAAPSMAATISIEGGANGSEYKAYQLMTATHGEEVAKGADDKPLTDENGNPIYVQNAYVINPKYSVVLKTVTSKTTDAEIIAYIRKLSDTDIRDFADDVYAEIKEEELEADKESENAKFNQVEQGYYLIVETELGDDDDNGSNDTYSLVMLDTAWEEEITITTKEDAPTVEKKVAEKNDSTSDESVWQDAADYDIGDEINFKLIGTVSAKYADYKTYYYAFHDNMMDGLTFENNSVTVKVDNGGTEKVISSDLYSVVVFDGEDSFDGCELEIIFEDLKEVDSVNADSKIIVEYRATLNNEAVVGNGVDTLQDYCGNINGVKLEYNKNPYFEGTGEETGLTKETGLTTEDYVAVFTYKAVVNKVDGLGNALIGAGFTLYKFDAETKDYVPVGDEIKGDDLTTFEFVGLDSGKYKLVETTVPNGYNKAEDILFEIIADYDIEAINPKLNLLKIVDENKNWISDPEKDDSIFNVSIIDGSITTDVVNKTGAELPSTGGIGTTIFYAVGIILMAGAVFFVVRRKRA